MYLSVSLKCEVCCHFGCLLKSPLTFCFSDSFESWCLLSEYFMSEPKQKYKMCYKLASHCMTYFFDPCQCCSFLNSLWVVFNGIFFKIFLFPVEKGMGCFQYADLFTVTVLLTCAAFTTVLKQEIWTFRALTCLFSVFILMLNMFIPLFCPVLHIHTELMLACTNFTAGGRKVLMLGQINMPQPWTFWH